MLSPVWGKQGRAFLKKIYDLLFQMVTRVMLYECTTLQENTDGPVKKSEKTRQDYAGNVFPLWRIS